MDFDVLPARHKNYCLLSGGGVGLGLAHGSTLLKAGEL